MFYNKPFLKHDLTIKKILFVDKLFQTVNLEKDNVF